MNKRVGLLLLCCFLLLLLSLGDIFPDVAKPKQALCARLFSPGDKYPAGPGMPYVLWLKANKGGYVLVTKNSSKLINGVANVVRTNQLHDGYMLIYVDVGGGYEGCPVTIHEAVGEQ